MALSIVADASSAPDIPGVSKTTRWVCDVYRGTADALVDAGLITLSQLKPQKGRRAGYTVFLADGSQCPPEQRSWRQPGYKSILQVDDGTYLVEVTVSKEVQAWRRKADKAAEHEREQQRIDKALAENGARYRNWQMKHGFIGDPSCGSYQVDYEWWEGTKAQLQQEGIGVGMLFPGEPGAPQELYCKCPLGFHVRVYLPGSGYAPEKAAARIYTAQSWYVPRNTEPKQYVQHAPGVMREVWRPLGWNSRLDFYQGSPHALVAAGLVPALHLFPGQPGMNKHQASYRKDWTPATNPGRRDFGAILRRRGKSNEFCLELPVSDAEEKRREEVCNRLDKERSERSKVLAAERQQLRQGLQPEKTVEVFRTERAEMAEILLKLIWKQVFTDADGALSFDLEDGSELRDEVADAFQTIRDVVKEAGVLRDKKHVAAVQTRLKLVAARNDTGLQSVLQDAKGLRLVHSASPKEQD
jgi:hypothetical protein